ncbi:sugar-binding transcriptional regulator [Marinivivus vitaminiproducens]|uniref:sugar-binding transcriptional regulator n=1 Tax=Marinivivus vitaminiproducens TaxID=3035935 RepID=UPI00279FECCD|nr:sugar-binding transcriptional regulator [Geminicoccaceae bacterium SCSIO 64248]
MSVPTPAVGGAEGEQLMTRVIWYYFVAGMTQQQIADKLGITRLRANRMIGSARANSLVRIEVRMPLARCVALEEEIRQHYGLQHVTVVPAVDDDQAPQRIVGQAAAALLEPMLVDGKGFGLGWGRTLSSLVRGLAPRRLPNAWTVTLMGSLTRGSGINTFEVSTQFAGLMGMECHYVAAPIYCPSSESRTTLLTHEGLAEAMRRAGEVDVALLSCGDLSTKSLLAQTQIVRQCVPELREAGAVGDILGVFLDADGTPVDHPLNSRVMALPPAELRRIPTSILVSGGINKAPIIKAITKAGYVTHLVTDESVAEAMV